MSIPPEVMSSGQTSAERLEAILREHLSDEDRATLAAGGSVIKGCRYETDERFAQHFVFGGVRAP